MVGEGLNADLSTGNMRTIAAILRLLGKHIGMIAGGSNGLTWGDQRRLNRLLFVASDPSTQEDPSAQEEDQTAVTRFPFPRQVNDSSNCGPVALYVLFVCLERLKHAPSLEAITAGSPEMDLRNCFIFSQTNCALLRTMMATELFVAATQPALSPKAAFKFPEAFSSHITHASFHITHAAPSKRPAPQHVGLNPRHHQQQSLPAPSKALQASCKSLPPSSKVRLSV